MLASLRPNCLLSSKDVGPRPALVSWAVCVLDLALNSNARAEITTAIVIAVEDSQNGDAGGFTSSHITRSRCDQKKPLMHCLESSIGSVYTRCDTTVDHLTRLLISQPVDSYEGFRSDFIHFSPSITTFGRSSPSGAQGEGRVNSSSFHFTPKGFSHFFAWWRQVSVRANNDGVYH